MHPYFSSFSLSSVVFFSVDMRWRRLPLLAQRSVSRSFGALPRCKFSATASSTKAAATLSAALRNGTSQCQCSRRLLE